MLSETLFNLGPFKICFWNLIFLGIIFLSAAILRRIIHRFLKNYLTSANISLEGRRKTWLKLVSQSVYLLAIYIGVLSFKFNNPTITFRDFLRFKIIDLDNFKMDFYSILVIISVFFGARIFVNMTTLFIGKRFRNRANIDPGTEYVYTQIAKYIIYTFSILLCFQILNINVTIFLTGSAALLVGIGLGLQDVFKDMIAGIVLLIERNVRVGDIVEIQNKTGNGSKGQEGIVAKIVKINVRTTEIQTREGNVLIIPNTRLTQEQVENWSHGSELTRFIINVTVEYGSDIELIQNLLKQAAYAHPKVKKTHPVMVRLADFGDNGLNLELVFWADQSWDINNYKSEIRLEIDRLFREYKISIPYQKRTVHVVNDQSRNSYL